MKRISLELGSGGKLMRDFIETHIKKTFQNPLLDSLSDSAHLPGKIAFTTDSYVVSPIFFPGGDIGTLSVYGTVNDLVVSGARPEYLSLALILEEGFSGSDLERILQSVKTAADEAEVAVVTGDTKVVRKGQGDQIYINTAGVGTVIKEIDFSHIQPGDKIVVTGNLGEHSLAIMTARGDFGMESDIRSDCAPLNFLLPFWARGVYWMRDITRGGLGTVLCELAENLPFPVLIEEETIPLSKPVRAASELLGIDPLFLPCEGRAVMVVPGGRAENIVKNIRENDLGRDAAIIGTVENTTGKAGEVLLETLSGGLRLIEPLTSELLPRIC